MPQPFADEFKTIQMSPNLGESLERARVFAREQSHRAVLLEHLLLALTEDPDAAAVMQASNVDPLRLGTDISGYLGRLLEDMRAPAGFEPQADAELLRVLQAAGQAAQQSRRRQIDGAIVLAAVVGDGKSPAAGVLKAHGLTFEEAIRALQKATTAANAKARSQLYAPSGKLAVAPAAAETPPAPAAPAEPDPPPPPAAVASAAPDDPAAQTPQSVDDILAAARARIQQRTTAIVSRPKAKAPPSPPPPPAVAAESDPLPLSALTSGAPPPAPAPPEEFADEFDDPPEEEASAPPQAPQLRSSWAPPPTPAAGQQAPRLPHPPPQRPPGAFPNRPLQSGEGPPRPPLPQRAPRHNGPPQPGFPNRPQQVPWPNQADPGMPGPPPMNGAAHAEAPHQRPPRPGQRTAGQGGQGPLVETIPRRMRLGSPAPAQVRITRDKIDGLILLLLSGRGMPHRPDAFVARALTVRLRAPDGGFVIEPGSPETQWVEAAAGLQQDEFVGWRWNITPQRRGRGRLLLVVTARTVGRDGIAAETSPPDRVIEVVVKGGRLRGVLRWSSLLIALLLGAAIDRFGTEFWRLGAALFKRMTGG
jgi:neural Wiskott-Aldrich syndrome protein